MKRYQTANLWEQVFIPVTAYLLTGLVVLRLSRLPVNSLSFVVWGILAGMILGVKEYFANKTVTAAMGIYLAAAVVFFGFFMGAHNRIHAVLAALGIGGVLVFQKIFRIQIIKVLFGYAMLILLICCDFAGMDFSRGLIALAILLFLNSVSETLSCFYGGNVNSLILIYAVIALITVVTPVSEEPYDWGFIKNMVRALEEMVEKVTVEIQYQWGFHGSDGIFHYGFTGYSEEPFSLSSNLYDSNIMQLMLAGERTKRNLYLKGNVCDTYTGDSWENALHRETVSYQTDTLMTLYAVFDAIQDETVLRRFMEVKEQEITLLNMKTQSLFYPLKLLNISADSAEQDGDNLRADRVNGRGYTYAYEFLDFDYASPELVRIMENSKDISYNEETYYLIFDRMKEYYGVELDMPDFSRFLAQAEQGKNTVRESYMTLGDQVSEDVKKLADTITLGCVSDYEKCKALERYLYQYSYNKIIHVPEQANILDWFLFDGKEGYCAHYATALAVMLRCEGIPSRIAEGFLVDYEDLTDFYHYTISSGKAHVWVEAYIEGFGWVRLEPTVVNAANANLVWYADAAQQDETEEEEAVPVIPDENPETGDGEKAGNIWVMAVLLLGGMAVIVTGTLLFFVIRRSMDIRKSSNPDIVLRHLLSVLGKQFSPKEDSETLQEYFRRISDDGQVTDEMRRNLSYVREVMERYWYGEGSPAPEEVKKIKEIFIK